MAQPTRSATPTMHLIGDPAGRVLRHRSSVHVLGSAAISPVVKPFALNDKTISSIPVNRRCRFLTICGSNVDSVSRGTSMVTGPI